MAPSVNEDDEWEWYEEEDEEDDSKPTNAETTNAETFFAQRRKSSCKVDTMFTFNQVQTKVAEISTSNHHMSVPPLTPGAETKAEPVWLSTEEMLSLKLEMAKTSANYNVSDADLSKVKVTDQPVILTCAKKRRSDEATSVIIRLYQGKNYTQIMFTRREEQKTSSFGH